MNDTYAVGEFVRLKDDYSWANGKYAGAVVQITEVHDHRELLDDADALIYGARFVDPRDGAVMAGGIPVSPEDIDEEYDHYEARQAASWNAFLSYVMA